MKPKLRILLLLCCLGAYCLGANEVATAREEWRNDWIVEDGFALTIDAGGFEFPSAIAFVPEPGREPHSPLYFVTELDEMDREPRASFRAQRAEVLSATGWKRVQSWIGFRSRASTPWTPRCPATA